MSPRPARGRGGPAPARALLVLAALLVLVAGRPPERGGTVAVLLPDHDEGRRIGAALTRRMVHATLTEPDGTASRLEARPSAGDARRSTIWCLTLGEGDEPRGLRARVMAALPELLATATGPPWTDLRSVGVRAGDGRAHPDTLVVGFTGAVSDPRPRFGRWTLPRSLVDGPFRPAGSDEAGATETRFVRSPRERRLASSRLDEITLTYLPAPERPDPGMLVVRPAGGPPMMKDESIEIVYVVRVPEDVTASTRAWIQGLLTPAAFAPLVSDQEGGRVDAWPTCPAPDPGEAVPPPPAVEIVVSGPEGGRPGRVTRRARVILEEARGERASAPDAGPAITVAVEPVVILERSPVVDPLVGGGQGYASPTWPVLVVRYVVERGDEVRGPLGAPERWWRVPVWRSPAPR